ncbi:MAG: hypothetical protein L3K14_05255 [Thermoplasmata archaeon]|nr:hypothetical protein [Thermoplasmata archaeon]
MKRRQRTVYLVTIAAMVAMIGGYALAATTVTIFAPPQSSNVTQGGTLGGFSSMATVTSEQLVVVSAAMSAVLSAGAQGASAGLSGTSTQLAVCAGAPCASQTFKAATPTTTTGDYGEQITLNVFQSAANSAIGFDMAITVVTTAGTVTAFGYVQIPTSAVTQTIPVFLFVDLGTTNAPVITAVSVVFNQCSTGTTCP